MADASLEELIVQFRDAASAFARGDPEPVKALYANTEDVVLANPFGPAVRGWDQVSAALERAASSFRDGRVIEFERVAEYGDGDLMTIHEREQWEARVGDGAQVTGFELRVTTTFRRTAGEWRIVHRHADPIATADDAGPLRAS